jgi:quercetin 2,3-dioxygenase
MGRSALRHILIHLEALMHMTIRRSADRGHADHGWLDSHHSFSFAGYHDPDHMGFGALRVINQDRVEPGRGFGTHPHRDMEIISYVVEGALGHRDTIGTGSTIRPGEVQLMSAGRGIAHSEMNASKTEPVHFLQIWIMPSKAGTEPRYDQKAFPTDIKGLQLVASPDGRDGSLTIGANAEVHRLLLAPAQTAALAPSRNRNWVQVVRGTLEVNGALLQAGDGLAVTGANTLAFKSHGEDVEALVFDLA